MNPTVPHPMGVSAPPSDSGLGLRTLELERPFTEARARHTARAVRSDDGRVTVKYWRSRWKDKKRRRIYTKWFFILAGRREAQNTERATQARAKEVANSIANGEISLLTFNQADRASYLRARELLRPTGKSLELAAAEYAEVLAILRAGLGEVPAGTLATAAREFVTHHASRITARTVPALLQELLAARRADGAAQNTLDDLDSRLSRFARDFTGPITGITGPDINTWLRKLSVTRRTRNNYRGALVAFYRFAKQSEYLPRAWPVLDDVPRVKDEPVRISIFTPEEIVRIIAARETIEERMADRRRPYKTLIPYLVIAAFAGPRHEEMCAGRDPQGRPLPVLDWRQVDLKRKRIHVLEEVARKIGRDRIVPMTDNLVAWLTPYARASGPICELANANNAFQRAARLAGIPWKDNGLRRSFISYRLAIVKDIGQVALEAGTSPERINKNYKKTQDEEDGQRWFGIHPIRADIEPLFAWAKRVAN
jgi:integrase